MTADTRRRGLGYNERLLEAVIPSNLKELRTAFGWTQRELAARAATSQSTVARAELARLEQVPLPDLARMFDAMDARLQVSVSAPMIVDRRRQREPVHARTGSYVHRKQAAAGWSVVPEVEVHGVRAHGWIDLLAFHAASRTALVDEIKTDLHDIGGLGRQVAWYEREAWHVARGLGWRPRRIVTVVFVLLTQANDDRIRQNRDVLRDMLPGRALDVAALLHAPETAPNLRRALVMVDPLRRGQTWLIKAASDGRRTPAPHLDYADVARKLTPRPRTRRRLSHQ
jgi:transcriptional regulator with XRE-family HTH domain